MGFEAPFCARLPRLFDRLVDKAQRTRGSTSFGFDSRRGLVSLQWLWFDLNSCDLGSTILFVKTVD